MDEGPRLHEPDLHEPDRAAEPARPTRPSILALTARCLGAAAVIGALSFLARERTPSHPLPLGAASAAGLGGASSLAAARPPGVAGGHLRLDAEGGDPVRTEPARGPDAGTIGRGDFSAIEAPHLRLTLTRAAEPAPSLFVTLVRRAADGLNLSVVRTGARGRIETKFGAVETLEATLAGPTRRICTGFVTREAAPLRIEGWLCAPLGQPPEPRALACTLDALSLDGRTDPATEAAFAAAARRRDPACRTPSVSAGDPAFRTGSIRRRRAPTSARTI